VIFRNHVVTGVAVGGAAQLAGDAASVSARTATLADIVPGPRLRLCSTRPGHGARATTDKVTPMRTISIQADGDHLDQIMAEWLAHLVTAIPVGPHGIKFDGDLSSGTIVNHRAEGRWAVSFRPNPDGSRRRTYADPYVVARVIIAREHETVASPPA
jgi:hypothetical protein